MPSLDDTALRRYDVFRSIAHAAFPGLTPPDMPKQTAGDFEIDTGREIGRGAAGVVYHGRQISLDRPVAVKVLRVDPLLQKDFTRRFRREAGLLARLIDAHVVQVFGAGQTPDGAPFYAMEFVRGKTLADRMGRRGRIPVDEILRVAEGVGLALQAAGRSRIVHRDIKPSNVLLTQDGMVKVTDFGLACQSGKDATLTTGIVGTVSYMSPEQAQGQTADIRTDLYALGVVLYEMATGELPFTGDTPTSVLFQHVHKEPAPPRRLRKDLPHPVETLILKCMAKDPDRRYATPGAFLEAVRAVRSGGDIPEVETSAPEPVSAGIPSASIPVVTTPTGRSFGSGGGIVVAGSLLLIAATLSYLILYVAEYGFTLTALGHLLLLVVAGLPIPLLMLGARNIRALRWIHLVVVAIVMMKAAGPSLLDAYAVQRAIGLDFLGLLGVLGIATGATLARIRSRTFAAGDRATAIAIGGNGGAS